METIYIKETLKTPLIKSDPEQGLIMIKGRSSPENSVVFYKPLFDWLTNYVREPLDKTTIHIQLEHFNTSSSKCILEIFKKLEVIQSVNRDVIVNWCYDKNDLDILEAGENYETMTKLPFKMVPC